MRSPFENPDESFHSPEYLAGLLQNCEEELERIGELYSIMRGELAEKEAWKLHGAFQAAASGKSIEECRRIASHKLRAPCHTCGQTGVMQTPLGSEVENPAPCKDCDGSGFIQLPALHWMQNGKVQFRLLPHDHPDYDPSN